MMPQRWRSQAWHSAYQRLNRRTWTLHSRVPSRFFRALLCENIVSHDRKDVVDDLTAVIHVVHPLNTLALDERHQTNMLLALSTVAAQDDQAVSRCDNVWKSNHKGFLA